MIVDDHNMFVDGLRSMLQTQENIDIVATAADGAQAIKYLRINAQEEVNLVITDINMPQMDGVELNATIKKEFPSIKTLAVSMLEDPLKIKSIVEQGLNGYVSKNAEKQELIRAIDTILAGDNYYSARIKSLLVEAMLAQKNIDEIVLTRREKQVLVLIAKEFTTQEIADQLFLSKHTIESYRKNLISKLNVRNLAGLTRYAIESGLEDSSNG